MVVGELTYICMLFSCYTRKPMEKLILLVYSQDVSLQM